MHYVYIIYSASIDKYYVGESSDVKIRLTQHNAGTYSKAWTSKSRDWELKKAILFENITQARIAEAFIKKMKSRRFIEELIINAQWMEEKFKQKGHSPEASGRIL